MGWMYSCGLFGLSNVQVMLFSLAKNREQNCNEVKKIFPENLFRLEAGLGSGQGRDGQQLLGWLESSGQWRVQGARQRPCSEQGCARLHGRDQVTRQLGASFSQSPFALCGDTLAFHLSQVQS